MNTFKCMRMHLYAACEECNRMECNENVENALECNKMHKNAYGKKPHHFREKPPRIPKNDLEWMVRAIPAVIAYNKLSGDINRYAGRLEAFINDFSAILSRQLQEKQ